MKEARSRQSITYMDIFKEAKAIMHLTPFDRYHRFRWSYHGFQHSTFL